MKRSEAELHRETKRLVERVRQLLDGANPGPWNSSDSGHVTDCDGYVIAHLTARRGANRWETSDNPNAELIAESEHLLRELTSLLDEYRRRVVGEGGDE